MLRFRLTSLSACLWLAACSSPAPEETTQAAAPAPVAAPPVAPSAAAAWAGTWTYQAEFASATLTITPRPDATTFDFTLEALDGAHTGELSGRAKLQHGEARYAARTAEEGPCQLLFRLSADSLLTVEQVEGTCGAGAGVSFAGRYAKTRKVPAKHPASTTEATLLSRGVLHNAQEDAAFRRLVGADYRRFAASAQLVSEDTTAEFPGATVYDSFVRGLGSVMQNIIVVDQQHGIWAAVVAGDSILYYTSRPEYARRLPATLARWHAAMGPEKTVVYRSARP